MLTDGIFCPIPWTGLMFNFDGNVKNCIRSAGTIGNLCDQDIDSILHGEVNQRTQHRMLSDQPGEMCHTCYDLERGKKRLDIISDRIFYMRELKKTPLETYRLGNHDLSVIDVRWTNLCNFSCIYCGPEFSSRWAVELGKKIKQPSVEQIESFKRYIFDRAPNLKHVYMAGGEPLLMKENLELLRLLKDQNPQINLRINTNLSKVDTEVFETICQFPNVHWIVSVESTSEQFEYIRHGGSWKDFLDNLGTIKKLNHKISFNMLYFLLNYQSFFDCLEYLQNLGFHNNSFIAGVLSNPDYLNVRHLPDAVLQSIKCRLESEIEKNPGYLLEDSLRNIRRNIRAYIDVPIKKNLDNSFEKLEELDRRRKLDSTKIFTELYSLK